MKLDGVAKSVHIFLAGASLAILVDFHFVNFIKSNVTKLWHPCWKSKKIMKLFGNELAVVVQSYAVYSGAIPFIPTILRGVGYM